MIKNTLRGVAAHKLRLLTTALAVMLGVAFMSGTLVLTDTLGAQFDTLVADVNEGTDVYIRKESAFSTGGHVVRDRLEEALVADVSTVDGVAAVAGRVEGWAQLIGADGEPVGGTDAGAASAGGNWIPVTELNPYRLVEGTPPDQPNEIVIDRGSARRGELRVGATATVLVKGGPRTVTIAGIATFGDADSMLGTSTVLFRTEDAQQLVGEPGRYDGIAIVAVDSVSPDTLATRLRASLPAGVEALTGAVLTAEAQGDVADDLGFFNTFMMTFAVIALFVGSFIIFNTFSIVVAQRTRELAVLRALGASRRQVMTSVIVEALLVGVVASGAGLASGVGVASLLRTLFESLGIDIPGGSLVIAPSSMLTALVVGAVITILSAVLPARRASQIPPVAAMRDVAIDTSAGSRRRILSGFAATSVGAVTLVGGLAGGGFALVAVGATTVFLGVAILGPVIARPASRALGAPIAALRGVAGSLAKENAARSPRRTASTASALMIGVGLVGCITVIASSIKASVDSAISGGVRSEYVVSTLQFGAGGLDPSLAAALSELPEVAAVSGLRIAPALVHGDGTELAAMDTAVAERTIDPETVEGSFADIGADGIAVSEERALREGWTLGSTVEVGFADGSVEQLEVRAIYGNDGFGNEFVDIALVTKHAAQPFDSQVFVTLAEGVDPGAARAVLDAVVATHPNAELMTRAEFSAAHAADVDTMLGLVYALLALAVLIAVLGIANTLALSIFERSRELGLLRAVGMTKSQMRTSVRCEAVIIALLGTALGLLIGVGFGWAVVDALATEGIDQLVVPVAPLVVVAALATVAGVGAAVLPARRAARMDVLTALRAS